MCPQLRPKKAIYMCAPCTMSEHNRAHCWLSGSSCLLETGSEVSCRSQEPAEILEMRTMVEMFAVP